MITCSSTIYVELSGAKLVFGRLKAIYTEFYIHLVATFASKHTMGIPGR
jgi:hypothetical protein